jgi:hypothetical protein
MGWNAAALRMIWWSAFVASIDLSLVPYTHINGGIPTPPGKILGSLIYLLSLYSIRLNAHIQLAPILYTRARKERALQEF